jgi:Cu(I)/Ag(I) efflux system membrane fusion protein
MTINSPIGGIVIHKNAQEGMYVKTGTKIYTIADLTQVWVKLDAYEADLMWLRYGQKIEFRTEAYPGEVFVGTIVFIDPILTQMTRTVKVRVNAANPKMRLKPGMFVRAVVKAKVDAGGKVIGVGAALAGKWMCRMHPSVVKDSAGICDICEMALETSESLGYASANPTKAEKPLVIPATAALRTGTRAIVYVEVPDKKKPTFEGREIVLGPRAGKYYLVRHGLAEGDRVVTKGSFKLDAELQIRAKPSMMTPEGGGSGGAHQHGGPSAGAKQTGMGMSMKLPVVVREQLRRVSAAGRDVTKAVKAGDLAAIRSAFAALGKKVRNVDKEELQGHMKMLWKEYSMFLSNDGVEGKEVKNMTDAKRVAKEMKEHLASMKSGFGLMPEGKPTKASAISAEFAQQFAQLVETYLGMQEALAKDELEPAKASATKALDALSKVDMKLLKGDDHMRWMKISAELKPILSRGARGGDIKEVRKEFALLSEEMMVAAKRFGSRAGPLYRFKCPMAFDGRGGTWLQADDKTRNPYYGAAMLGCGEVTEVLQAVKKKAGPHE